MRDYGKVGPKFWTGETGKALKAAGPEAVIVAMYLMTSPHANMLGFYWLPKLYLAHETGLGIEGASKGLARAIEAGFCAYDDASEHVLVFSMARYQVGDQLSPNDKRCKGVASELSKCPKGALHQRFLEIYADAFHLPKPSPLEAPSKSLGSQEQEQEQEQEKASSLRSDSSSPAGEDPKAGKVAQLQQRLIAVTGEAVGEFNGILAKPNGLLPKVLLVNELRQKQVKRCLPVARAICERMYGAQTITGQFWRDYWAACDADDFHAGRMPGGKGHENWTPDFEFLTRPDVMTKLFERAVSAAEATA